MKVIMGVEFASQSQTLVDLVSAMKLPNLELDLTHVMEVWATPEDAPSDADPRTQPLKVYFNQLESEGRETLAATEKYAKERGIQHCSSQLLFGHISNELLQHTERLNADLLMLGSDGKYGGTPMIGSVGRKVISNARSSVLVVKDFEHFHLDGLTVIVATDHSPYAARCLELFTAWAPAGLARIILVSVFSERVLASLTSLYAYSPADARGWIRRELLQENERQIKVLQPLGAKIENLVEEGETGEVLARLMREHRADFLVLGSQGHGFLESLMVGSLSLEQALRRPYSVLLLRVPV